eukprot:gene2666-3436_t
MGYNRAQSYGGGIYMNGDSALVLQSSVVHNNTANDRDGGALATNSENLVDIMNCTLSDNVAGDDGGAVEVWGATLLTISGSSLVSHNTAVELGGGLALGPDARLVTAGVELSHNSAVKGGGIHGYEIHLVDTLVFHNEAVDGGGIYLPEGRCLINDSKILENSAKTGGGMVIETDGVAVMNGSIVSLNFAQENGGGVSFSASKLEMIESQLKANRAEFGGAIFCANGELQSKSAQIVANHANESGGAVYANRCTLVMEDGMFITNNSAVFGSGGALCLRHTSFGNITDAYLKGNRAGIFGGAVRMLLDSSLYMQEILTDANSCTYEGGDISASRSRVFISGSRLRGGYSYVRGGSIQLSSSKGVIVRSTIVESHSESGGAISCTGSEGNTEEDLESRIYLEGVSLRGNVAAETGGAAHLTFCEANVTRSKFDQNKAGQAGGGISVGTQSSCTVVGSAFVANEVPSKEGGIGGGIALMADMWSAEVEDTRFELCSAAQGSGIFSQMPHSSLVVRMQSLVFHENEALVGPNIHWIYFSMEELGVRSDGTHITCVNCTSSADSELLSTTAVSYSILLKNTDEPIQLIQLTSGTQLPSLIYVAKDFYENRTRLDTEDLSVVASSSAQLGGQTLISMNVTERTATFDFIILTGEPGRTYNLTFTPSAEEWESVNLNVEILPCNVGDVYSQDSNLCTPCEEDFIKFDNLSTPCHSCDGIDGLRCLGGSQFILEDGYWMSSEYIQAHCDSSDTTCVLSKVHECPIADACTLPTLPNRTNVHGESYIHTDMLCNTATGHKSNTVLCVGCSTGYRSTMSGYCEACPSADHLVWIHLALTVVVITLVVTALSRLFTYAQANSPHNEECIKSQIRSKTLAGILVGHIQVMSQTLLVFSSGAVPVVYEDFLASTVAYANLSVSNWVPLDCMMFGLGGGEQSNFYWEFSTYCSLLGCSFAVLFLQWMRPRAVAAAILRPFRCLKSQPSEDKAPSDDDTAWKKRRFGGVTGMYGNSVSYPYSKSQSGRSQQLVTQPAEVNPIAMHEAVTEDGDRSSKGFPFGLHEEDLALGSKAISVGPSALPSLQEPSSQGSEAGAKPSSISIEVAYVAGGEAAEPGGREWGLEEPGGAPLARRPSNYTVKPTKLEMWRKKSEATLSTRPSREDAEAQADARYSRFSLIGYILVFFHPTVATNAFQLFNCTMIHRESRQYWLSLDLQVECFTPMWYTFAGLSVCVIVVYIFGLPFCLFAVPYYLTRLKLAIPPGAFYLKEQGKLVQVAPIYLPKGSPEYDNEGMVTALHHKNALAFLAAYMHPFKDRFYYWLAFEMIRKLAQTSFVIIWQYIYGNSDLLYTVMITCLAVAIHAYCQPYESKRVNVFQTIILVDQVFVSIMMLAEEGDTTGRDGKSAQRRGFVILSMQLVVCVVLAVFVGIDLFVAYKVPALKALCRVLSAVTNRMSVYGVSHLRMWQWLDNLHQRLQSHLDHLDHLAFNPNA